MNSSLIWTAHPQFPTITEARCGTRLAGPIEEFDTGWFRWEIIPTYNVEQR